MRKEVIIAIFLGSLIGVGGAYLSLGQRPSPAAAPEATHKTANDVAPKQVGFTLESPTPNVVIGDNQLAVSGNSSSDSIVIIDTPTQTLFAARDGSTFTSTIALSEGVNRIAILELGQQTTSVSRDILMVPGTKDLLTKSGSITDITEGGIQIRQDNGEVSTIKTAPQTKYKNNSTILKELKSSEIAIGDVVYLAGHLVEKTFYADYVYVTTLAGARPQPVQATVNKTTKKDVIVSTEQGDQSYLLANYTLYSVNKTALTKIKTPVTGRRVIILPSTMLVIDEG